MPAADQLRISETRLPQCAGCGTIIVARVPAGLKGDFYHAKCRPKHYEAKDQLQSEESADCTTTRDR